MKRKATAQSIRAGQTLYYVSETKVFQGGQPEVGRIRIVSDRVPFAPKLGEVVSEVPRWVAVDMVVGAPGWLSHSRRSAVAGVKSYAVLLERLRDHQAKMSANLSLTLRRFASAARDAAGATRKAA